MHSLGRMLSNGMSWKLVSFLHSMSDRFHRHGCWYLFADHDKHEWERHEIDIWAHGYFFGGWSQEFQLRLGTCWEASNKSRRLLDHSSRGIFLKPAPPKPRGPEGNPLEVQSWAPTCARVRRWGPPDIGAKSMLLIYNCFEQLCFNCYGSKVGRTSPDTCVCFTFHWILCALLNLCVRSITRVCKPRLLMSAKFANYTWGKKFRRGICSMKGWREITLGSDRWVRESMDVQLFWLVCLNVWDAMDVDRCDRSLLFEWRIFFARFAREWLQIVSRPV